jgi:hypothetical protein
MSRAAAYVVGQFVLFGVLAVSLVVFPIVDSGILRWVGAALVLAAFALLALAVWEFQKRNATLPNVTPTPNSRPI